jgi:hypothetical protein
MKALVRPRRYIAVKPKHIIKDLHHYTLNVFEIIPGTKEWRACRHWHPATNFQVSFANFLISRNK